MTIAKEYAITISMYVERTYVVTGMDKDEAIAEAKDRICYETDIKDMSFQYEVEDHSKVVV